MPLLRAQRADPDLLVRAQAQRWSRSSASCWPWRPSWRWAMRRRTLTLTTCVAPPPLDGYVTQRTELARAPPAAGSLCAPIFCAHSHRLAVSADAAAVLDAGGAGGLDGWVRAGARHLHRGELLDGHPGSAHLPQGGGEEEPLERSTFGGMCVDDRQAVAVLGSGRDALVAGERRRCTLTDCPGAGGLN